MTTTKCFRCGRTSHTAHDCYAKSHVNGGGVKKVHYVYSLELEGGRKYVGKTDDINRRFDQHFSGNGAKWTKKYKPIGVIVYKNMSDYHGKSYVRGAGNTSSGCSRCGRESHNASKCYAKYHEDGGEL